MIAAWKQAGPHARDVFLLQKMQAIMASVVSTVDHADIEKVTVLKGAQDESAALISVAEQLKATLGLDLPKLLQQFGAKGGGQVALPQPTVQRASGRSMAPPPVPAHR